jgi:hypothetical protein
MGAAEDGRAPTEELPCFGHDASVRWGSGSMMLMTTPFSSSLRWLYSYVNASSEHHGESVSD